MSDAIFTAMILLPIVFTGVLVSYFIEGVLKYKFKNRIVPYAATTACSVALGIYLLVSQSALVSHSVVVTTDDPMVLVGYFVIYIILVASIDCKWWKKMLVVFLAFDILTIFNAIFSSMRDLMSAGLNVMNDTTLRPIYLVFNLFVIVVEFAFLALLDKVRSKNDKGPLPVTVMLAIWFFLGIFTGTFQIVLYDEETATQTDLGRSAASVFAMMAGLVFVLIFFYIRSSRRERDDLKQMNSANEELVETQTRYFEASVEADNKIRAIKHDMRNNLQVLSLLLESGEYDKMREYLEQLGAGLSSADITSHTGDLIADAIITEKKQKAASAGAKLNVTGVISGIEFAPVDMCKILGNILDNAIEAVSDERLTELGEEEKTIDLVFKKTDKFFMISLTNPCAECPEIKDGEIDTYKSDRKNHGFGLKNVREASEVYGGEMSLSCEEKASICMFRTELMFNLSA